jgi:hypothetical protein
VRSIPSIDPADDQPAVEFERDVSAIKRAEAELEEHLAAHPPRYGFTSAGFADTLRLLKKMGETTQGPAGPPTADSDDR